MRGILLATSIAMALLAGSCRDKEQAHPQETSQGSALYASACARCHGEKGGGGLPAYEGGPAPRNFQDHKFQATLTDEQIKETIVKGKPSGMPPFGTSFNDAQLRALVAQVRSFDPER